MAYVRARVRGGPCAIGTAALGAGALATARPGATQTRAQPIEAGKWTRVRWLPGSTRVARLRHLGIALNVPRHAASGTCASGAGEITRDTVVFPGTRGIAHARLAAGAVAAPRFTLAAANRIAEAYERTWGFRNPEPINIARPGHITIATERTGKALGTHGSGIANTVFVTRRTDFERRMGGIWTIAHFGGARIAVILRQVKHGSTGRQRAPFTTHELLAVAGDLRFGHHERTSGCRNAGAAVGHTRRDFARVPRCRTFGSRRARAGGCIALVTSVRLAQIRSTARVAGRGDESKRYRESEFLSGQDDP